MIRMGFPNSTLYPNEGITIKNRGTMIFYGICNIANNSSLEIGPTGTLIFGNGFNSTAQTCIGCHNKICFGNNVRVGWDCTFADTDYHALSTSKGKVNATEPINIGNNNWICMQSLILKGAGTPDYCTIAARSLLKTDYSNINPRVLLGGIPAKVLKTDIWRDFKNDSVNYVQI